MDAAASEEVVMQDSYWDNEETLVLGCDMPTDPSGLELSLVRWLELEPERCHFLVGENTWLVRDYGVWHKIGRATEDRRWFSTAAAEFARSNMLMRGWSFKLAVQPGYQPRVVLNVLDSDGSELVEVKGSAAALNDLVVEAYVDALETLPRTGEKADDLFVNVDWLPRG